MPELPEVETVVRTLRPTLEGKAIRGVWWSGLGLRLGRLLDMDALRAACRAGRFATIGRRGKYIVADLAGPRPGSLLVHLGMSGQLRLQLASETRPAHTHVVWSLDDGRELRFVDPRRFGWVGTAARAADFVELQGLGPDPLSELDEPMLRSALLASRAPIKSFLLDQRRVAGIGNIYACEALFRAKVHPATPSHRVARRAGSLVTAIQHALVQGIANRGTSLRDYVDAAGDRGSNQSALSVYDREGLPCLVCGALVKRQVQSMRSTFFCGRCQRR